MRLPPQTHQWPCLLATVDSAPSNCETKQASSGIYLVIAMRKVTNIQRQEAWVFKVSLGFTTRLHLNKHTLKN